MPSGQIKINPPPPPVITPPQKSTRYRGVKHTIMVMSGKGGVGKSTIAVNLAVSLARKYSVGLIDADITGPDDPKMLGVDRSEVEARDNKIIPISTKYNVDVISMGFLLPTEETAVIWRGALRHKAIQQFLEDVDWGEKDFIVIDMPPGTGDEALSVAQLVPKVDGVVIVVTPQDVALLDAKKAINFASQMKLPVIGIVENMSGFICPHCGKEVDIFKKGGGEEAARKYGVPFLGRIPLDPRVVSNSDSGVPTVSENSDLSRYFESIADNVSSIVSAK
ncbi:MAG TPA: Mrp/NBP35 family ATP-binding protein [Thermoplasmataceae archaeon]|nr:Mrp/NBP35 family ATP-binding protein [Thermoplasmatales archaeon AK]HLH86750.1 Mrp/NBP35 family ATP-binding protein [Thermoplasmataceae archaeon]